MADQSQAVPVVPARAGIGALLRSMLRSQAAMTTATLLVLMAFFTVLFPSKFLTVFNIQNLLIDYSGIVLLGVGLTFVMTSECFDLSIGATLVLASVLGVEAMVLVGGEGWSTVLVGLAATLLTGAAVGVFNGFLVVNLRIPSIIVTLGSLNVAQGLAYVLTGGQDMHEIPNLMVDSIGLGRVLGIPAPVLVSGIAVIVGAFVLSQTRFGRHTCALGSNKEAARRAGIDVNRLSIQLYVLSGMCAGLAGFMSLARFGTTTLSGHSTDFITALLGVVLGGTSLFGGVGTVLGTAVGVFIPGVLSNGLILMSVFPYWQLVIVGLVLCAVVYADLVKRRQRDD
ncbi:MAG: ABC transporter permease [Roseiflexaceae bacterium]|nr:ABC transporter permease [Roseiflexaceae bacterium]